LEYNNKTVWITGASSGIGRALVKRFSKENANIILSSRNVSELEKLKSEVESYGNKVVIEALDLANQDSFKEIVERVISEFGSIDLLINNGGISQRSLVEETSLDVDRKLMEVNFFGTVALTKAVLPYMLKQGGGQIAVVTSIVGKFGFPLRSAYSASKHALHGFFDSLRSEVYKYNIAVTLVLPGYVNTNLSYNALVGDGSEQNSQDHDLAKGLAPEEFAKKLINAIKKQKNEVVIAGAKETLSVYLKRFFPKLLSKLVRNVNT